MLYIELGNKTLHPAGHPDGLYDSRVQKEWFNDPFIIDIVEGISGAKVINYASIEHPYFGLHNYLEIAAGIKNVILGYKTDLILNGDFMGDNCLPWLLRAAEHKDIYVAVDRIFDFPDDVASYFKVHLINTDETLTSLEAFYRSALSCEWEWDYGSH